MTGAIVTALAPGTCTIQATQPGNSDYSAAAPVSQSLTVTSWTVLVPSAAVLATIN